MELHDSDLIDTKSPAMIAEHWDLIAAVIRRGAELPGWDSLMLSIIRNIPYRNQETLLGKSRSKRNRLARTARESLCAAFSGAGRQP